MSGNLLLEMLTSAKKLHEPGLTNQRAHTVASPQGQPRARALQQSLESPNIVKSTVLPAYYRISTVQICLHCTIPLMPRCFVSVEPNQATRRVTIYKSPFISVSKPRFQCSKQPRVPFR